MEMPPFSVVTVTVLPRRLKETVQSKPMRFITFHTSQPVNGPGFMEYALIRLDGENWDSDEGVENKLVVHKNDSFTGWDVWKVMNRT